jgi:hypothetical protein
MGLAAVIFSCDRPAQLDRSPRPFAAFFVDDDVFLRDFSLCTAAHLAILCGCLLNL